MQWEDLFQPLHLARTPESVELRTLFERTLHLGEGERCNRSLFGERFKRGVSKGIKHGRHARGGDHMALGIVDPDAESSGLGFGIRGKRRNSGRVILRESLLQLE